jgi:hypothetical protein
MAASSKQAHASSAVKSCTSSTPRKAAARFSNPTTRSVARCPGKPTITSSSWYASLATIRWGFPRNVRKPSSFLLGAAFGVAIRHGFGHFYIMKVAGFGQTCWAIHMILLILLGTLIGVIFKEWKGCRPRTHATLMLALALLIAGKLLLDSLATSSTWAPTLPPTWRTWPPIRRRNGGGPSVSLVRSHFKAGRRTSGGPEWKRFFTSTDALQAGRIVAVVVLPDLPLVSATVEVAFSQEPTTAR